MARRRRKKNARKRKRKRQSRAILPRFLGDGNFLPRSLTRTHVLVGYHDFAAMPAATAGNVYFGTGTALSLNDIYSLGGATGGQPRGRDQLAAWYKQYHVISSKIEATIDPSMLTSHAAHSNGLESWCGVDDDLAIDANINETAQNALLNYAGFREQSAVQITDFSKTLKAPGVGVVKLPTLTYNSKAWDRREHSAANSFLHATDHGKNAARFTDWTLTEAQPTKTAWASYGLVNQSLAETPGIIRMWFKITYRVAWNMPKLIGPS